MTAPEKNILQTLTELDVAVKAMPTSQPKPDLLPLFRRLDALALELPQDADPNLRHYLAKKSYEKARLFLLGQDCENKTGNCGHV